MLAIIFLYTCFTATMFLGSFILQANHYPFFVAGMRFFGAGVMLLTIHYIQHKQQMLSQMRQLLCWKFLQYALCLYCISAVGFSWSMQYVDPVKACFVFVLAPFVTALLLYLLKNERLSKQKMVGLAIGFCAIIPIILQTAHGPAHHIPWHLATAGYIVFGCAVITFAYGWILNQQLYKIIHAPSLLITGSALVVGGGITLAIATIINQCTQSLMQLTDDFYWLLLLFAIVTAVAYNLYAQLLQRYSATFISFASFLEPACGLMYAATFLGQPISIISICSLCALGLGLYIFYQQELKFA